MIVIFLNSLFSEKVIRQCENSNININDIKNNGLK